MYFLLSLIVFPLFLFAEMQHFAFIDEPIDVVIPAAPKDLSILNLCIQGIREYGENIRRIIVVSKERLTDQAEWFDEGLYPFSYDDVARALAKEHPRLVDYMMHREPRTGWYFQQLLKIYAPLVIPAISSNVLILDADVIFLRPISFMNKAHAGLYNVATTFHEPYFPHAKRLLPDFRKVFPQYSGITHHMLFQRSVIEALLQEVEGHHHRPSWYAFCYHVAMDSLTFSGASEYEIYFNFVFAHTDQVALRPLKWKDLERRSQIQESKEQGMDYVCLHSYARLEE